ncbi:MAG: mechanosensitive ion channel [Bacteroidales bacterium]|nr:MAG: mechanosensitive ion channel [Bacteroidales bacterium]
MVNFIFLFISSLFLNKGIFNPEKLGGRILLIVIIAVGAHILVIIIKRLSRLFFKSMSGKSGAKVMSVVSLLTSIIVFMIYFLAIGYILKSLGISLTAYMASASVIGLAVGFGSQGMVQDIVTGFTLIVSNLIDIGEMVEVNGQIGIVKSIGMRFVVIRNAMGAQIYFPNRNINIVINYTKGYVSCIVDIRLPENPDVQKSFDDLVNKSVKSVNEKYPNILRGSQPKGKTVKTSTGKEYKRIIFRIWPGRGAPIESTFKQELIQELKLIDPNYADWMVSVNYEIEKERIK